MPNADPLSMIQDRVDDADCERPQGERSRRLGPTGTAGAMVGSKLGVGPKFESQIGGREASNLPVKTPEHQRFGPPYLADVSDMGGLAATLAVVGSGVDTSASIVPSARHELPHDVFSDFGDPFLVGNCTA